MDTFDLFIITGKEEDVQNITSLLERYLGLRRKTPYRFIFKYEDIDKCIKLINSFKSGTRYRIWAHLGLRGEDNFDYKKTFGAFEKQFKDVKINLITREKISFGKKIEDGNHRAFFMGDLDDCQDFNNINILTNVVGDSQNASLVKIDYIVITALKEEFDPFLDFNLSLELRNDLFHIPVHLGYITTSNNITKTILFARTSEAGMVDSAIFSSLLIERFKPNFLFMTGVCGGDPNSNSIDFGDIIIPKQVFTFQKGKVSDNLKKGSDEQSLYYSDILFERELESITLSKSLLQKIENSSTSIIDKIKIDKISKFKDYENFSSNINLHTDAMACSTIVINNKNFFGENIKFSNRKAVAVDMESFGVLRAAELAEFDTKALIIKSIMDKTSFKNDDAKKYASFTSARFLFHLLSTNILD